MTTVDLVSTASRHAERPFLVDGRDGAVITYGEAHERAARFAGALRELGVAFGDRVVVELPSSVDLALFYLGALHAGAVVVPVGPGFGRREMAAIVVSSAPRLALAADGSRMAAAAAEAGVRVCGLDAVRSGSPIEAQAGEEALAAVHFTSGTTGVPRGVAHRARSLFGNAGRFAGAMGLDSSNRFHGILPLTYLGGYYNLLLLPYSIGASVVIDEPFGAGTALDYWRVPESHGVDVLWFPPTIMAMLLELDRDGRGRAFCRERIRLAISGMAPLRPELRERFEEEYGIAVHENYGLAETLLVTSSTPARPSPAGSAGEPLPGVEVRVAAGEVLISTPDLFAGYMDVSATELEPPDVVDGRWLRTGDLGELGDGGVRITGRAKEIVIRGGLNISTREVELALEGVSGVSRLAVVGVPHDVLGEEVAVVVVPADGRSLAEVEPELRRQAADRLDSIQQPAVYLQIDQLPITTTGKVRAQVLRDLVAERLGAVPRRPRPPGAPITLELDDGAARAVRETLRAAASGDARLSAVLAELDARLGR